jgi:uncharacterized membrane protein required for colicin V production
MILSVSSTMGIVFDVVIIAMLVIFGLIGFRKGFFKSVLSLFSTLVVLIISILCAGYLANLINKIYDFTGLIAEALHGGIASMGAFYSETIPAGISGKDIVSSIPASTNGFLKKLMSYVLEPLSAADIEGLTVAEIVSGSFASIIMLLICAIVLFILIKVIIALATRLFDNITRNRVLGAANKLGGFAFGATKGFLIVLVFVVALTFLTVIPAVNTKITPIIQDNTKVAKPIYNYTDEFIEKHVIDGKVVQKWIDNLWENKYKGRGDDSSAEAIPDGTIENPYIITLTENQSEYIASITIDFTTTNDVYYIVDTTIVDHDSFALNVVIDGADLTVYDNEDLDTEVDIATLTNKTYVIKFSKTGDNAQVETILTFK